LLHSGAAAGEICPAFHQSLTLGAQIGTHSGLLLELPHMEVRNVAAERLAATERAERSKRLQASNAGRFKLSDVPQEPQRAAMKTPAMPAGAMEALLSLQVVEDPSQRRKKAVQRGRGLLDSLDSLKIAVLNGAVPSGLLHKLARDLKDQQSYDDPALAAIISQIEVRAAVELAKRGL
jgi:hypothetical protein